MLYNKSEYIETVRGGAWGPGGGVGLWARLGLARLGNCPFSPQASGNKVSRQSVLCGSQNIVLNGKVSSGTGEGCVCHSTVPLLVCPRCCRRQCFCPWLCLCLTLLCVSALSTTLPLWSIVCISSHSLLDVSLYNSCEH